MNSNSPASMLSVLSVLGNCLPLRNVAPHPRSRIVSRFHHAFVRAAQKKKVSPRYRRSDLGAGGANSGKAGCGLKNFLFWWSLVELSAEETKASPC